MAHSVFSARIYEADSPFYEGDLESLIIPTSDGEYGVLAHHRNLVIAIVPGIMKYRIPGEEMKTASVSEGMIRLEDGDVLVLVTPAERARDRAEEAKEIMLQKRSMQEYYSAEATLRRAMARLKASGNHEIN